MMIFIPGVPKNANAGRQWARYAANSDRQKFRKLAARIASESIVTEQWTAPEFCRITARQIARVQRRRDPTGLAERLKGILDGLVDAGAIPDDDEDHIEIVLARSAPGDEPGILLHLEPINAQ